MERIYDSFDDLVDTISRPRNLTDVELRIAKTFWDQAIRHERRKADCVSPLLYDVAEVKQYITLIKDYIAFLNDELTELAGIASVHGWHSLRYQRGEEKRKELSKYGEKFGNVV